MENEVKYGTFADIAEKFISSVGDLRELVYSALSENGCQTARRSTDKKVHWILLIDEVDVFMHKDFYGKTLRAAKSIRNDETRALLQYIFGKRATRLTIVSKSETLTNTKNLSNRFIHRQ